MRNKKLIEAINKVIEGVESGKLEYNWVQPACCNVGLLIDQIVGRANMLETILRGGVVWAKNQWLWYTYSNELLELNLDASHIKELEILSNPIICRRAKISTRKIIYKRYWYTFWKKTKVGECRSYYLYKQNYLAYLKAWVELLYEQDNEQMAKDLVNRKLKDHPFSNQQPSYKIFLMENGAQPFDPIKNIDCLINEPAGSWVVSFSDNDIVTNEQLKLIHYTQHTEFAGMNLEDIKSCLKYLEAQEEYERCAVAKNILNQFNGR